MRDHTYYEETAKGYDELHGEEQKRKLLVIKNNLDIKKEQKVLDIGGGTGISSEIINAQITILEPSKEMTKIAKEKRNLETINEEAEKIQELFKENEYDASISVTVAHHFHDTQKVIQGIKKVTKTKGDIVFSLLKRSEKTSLIKKELEKEFLLKKEIEEEKDIILFFKNSK